MSVPVSRCDFVRVSVCFVCACVRGCLCLCVLRICVSCLVRVLAFYFCVRVRVSVWQFLCQACVRLCVVVSAIMDAYSIGASIVGIVLV